MRYNFINGICVSFNLLGDKSSSAKKKIFLLFFFAALKNLLTVILLVPIEYIENRTIFFVFYSEVNKRV